MDPHEVELVRHSQAFDRLGPDSLALSGMIGGPATELRIQIETPVLFDHPTIEALSNHLGQG